MATRIQDLVSIIFKINKNSIFVQDTIELKNHSTSSPRIGTYSTTDTPYVYSESLGFKEVHPEIKKEGNNTTSPIIGEGDLLVIAATLAASHVVVIRESYESFHDIRTLTARIVAI